MNYGNIKQNDIANGEGVRVSLFVSGCTHHCKNCFNKEAWDFSYGEPFTTEVWERIFGYCDHDYITGLTLLGGEPMEPQNQRALLPFLREFKRRFPGKSIWCYTGFLYEQLTGEHRVNTECTDEILSMLDILVDGEFVDELKSLGLRFRGSSNQRVIDVPATRASGSVVLWSGVSEDKKYSDAKPVRD